MDIDANAYIKQTKSSLEIQTVYVKQHIQLFGPDNMARQAAEAEVKKKNAHCGSEKEGWD